MARWSSRRRGRFLRTCAVAALAFGAGVVVATRPDGADGDSSSAAQRAYDRMSMRERVGQLIVTAVPGRRVNGKTRRLLRRERPAGVILFGENIASLRQTRTLTRGLQAARSGRSRARLIVSTDQEGGSVKRFHSLPPGRSQAAIGRAGSGAARSSAKKAAAALRREGVNTNLAPVLDVWDGVHSVMATRSYGSNPSRVANLGVAAVRSYRRGHVISTGKHFPGIGSIATNTDDRPQVVHQSLVTLRRNERPFEAAAKVGLPMVMVSHAIYPALDRGTPASLSRPVISGELRGHAGFEGVVITDSLEAGALRRQGSLSSIALRSFRAGSDLLLFTGNSRAERRAYDRLLAAVRANQSDAQRLKQSVLRVLEMKASYGLLPGGS